MPNSLCTNCKTYDYKCTYAPKVSGSIYLSLVAHSPPRNERWIQSEFLGFRIACDIPNNAHVHAFRYIQSLETQLAQAQEALRLVSTDSTLCPLTRLTILAIGKIRSCGRPTE